MKTIITTNGKYKSCKKGLCECIIGQDPNSRQPHLIKCKKPVAFVWFWRQWFAEIIKGSAEPIYSNIGAPCCQECFDKIKDNGPPEDLEHYREMWKKNQDKKDFII